MTNLFNEIIYCCKCKKNVEAELKCGQGIYVKADEELQKKLWHLPFWQCPHCKNFVGCHHKTKTPTKPLGCIPTKEIRNARQHIHKLIDHLWKSHKEPYRARAWLYKWIANKIGKTEFHTAEIRSVEEAREIYKICLTIKNIEDCRND